MHSHSTVNLTPGAQLSTDAQPIHDDHAQPPSAPDVQHSRSSNVETRTGLGQLTYCLTDLRDYVPIPGISFSAALLLQVVNIIQETPTNRNYLILLAKQTEELITILRDVRDTQQAGIGETLEALTRLIQELVLYLQRSSSRSFTTRIFTRDDDVQTLVRFLETLAEIRQRLELLLSLKNGPLIKIYIHCALHIRLEGIYLSDTVDTVIRKLQAKLPPTKKCYSLMNQKIPYPGRCTLAECGFSDKSPPKLSLEEAGPPPCKGVAFNSDGPDQCIAITPFEASRLRRKRNRDMISVTVDYCEVLTFDREPSTTIDTLISQVSAILAVDPTGLHLTSDRGLLRRDLTLAEQSLTSGSRIDLDCPLGSSVGYLNSPERWAKGSLDGRVDNLECGWEKYIHPDGQPYYVTVKDSVTIVTDDRITGNHQASNRLAEIGCKLIAKLREKFPDICVPALELYLSRELTREKHCYYFVNCDLLQVFWLAEPWRGQADKLQHNDSLERFLSRNFLRHVENFPTQSRQYNELCMYLRSCLRYAATEQLLFPNKAVSLFSDCSAVLGLLDSLQADQNWASNGDEGGGKNGGENMGKHGENRGIGREGGETPGVLGRVGPNMGPGKHGHARPWYSSEGQNWFVAAVLGELLCPEQSRAYGSLTSPSYRNAEPQDPLTQVSESLCDICFNLLSFGIYQGYLRQLQSVWRDKKVTVAEWQRLQDLLGADWSDSNLLATVLLSANMGFLAIVTSTNIQHTCVVISTFFATGSLVVGLYNTANHRAVQSHFRDDSQHGNIYFKTTELFLGSLRWLAILLALPLVLLVWSLSTFAFAIVLFAFMGKEPIVSSIFQAITIGALVISFSVLSLLWFLRAQSAEKVQQERQVLQETDDFV